MLDMLKRYREDLHKIPEESLKEFKTNKYLVNELNAMGYETIPVLETGILVYINNNIVPKNHAPVYNSQISSTTSTTNDNDQIKKYSENQNQNTDKNEKPKTKEEKEQEKKIKEENLRKKLAWTNFLKEKSKWVSKGMSMPNEKAPNSPVLETSEQKQK